jgi:hypothetical protein
MAEVAVRTTRGKVPESATRAKMAASASSTHTKEEARFLRTRRVPATTGAGASDTCDIFLKTKEEGKKKKKKKKKKKNPKIFTLMQQQANLLNASPLAKLLF